MKLKVLILACTVFAAIASNKPHLIFVMIDDWGWYEMGFHGNKLAQTPFVDNMVTNESLLIERHYGYKFCSPSRRSFLTGRFPPHVGQTNSPDAAIDLRMKTIADKLTAAGYVTGHSGKWHAGFFSMKQIPHGRGFSTSLGFLYGVDHWTQQSFEKVCKYGHGGNSTDLWDTDRPARGMNGTYGDYMYVGHAVKTIMQHNTSNPLFYYLATEVAHMPNEAPPRFLNKFDPHTVPFEPVYAMSSVVDESLANVTAALKAKGMWSNTLMVVASDNGGPLSETRASNFPLRGGKTSWLEGGIRTTAWVTGGLLPPEMRGKNLSSAHPIAMCDWHSTFLALAGADGDDDGDNEVRTDGGGCEGDRDGDGDRSGDVSGGRGDNDDGDRDGDADIGGDGDHGASTRLMQQKAEANPIPGMDGVNMWPVLSGASTTPLRTEIFVGSGVLIQGDYKLIATSPGSRHACAWSGPLYPKVPAPTDDLSCSEGNPCLFDVVSDYREQRDLAIEKPDVLATMQARLKILMEGVFEGEKIPNATQEKVCVASVANGMWITPYDWPSLPPTPPPTPPSPSPSPPQPPLPEDAWLAFKHQWEASDEHGGAYTITAQMDHAVLKKKCANSKDLPPNETRFFDKGRVVVLTAPPINTSVCPPRGSYYEVMVHL